MTDTDSPNDEAWDKAIANIEYVYQLNKALTGTPKRYHQSRRARHPRSTPHPRQIRTCQIRQGHHRSVHRNARRHHHCRSRPKSTERNHHDYQHQQRKL